jgi:hypothetical protein
MYRSSAARLACVVFTATLAGLSFSCADADPQLPRVDDSPLGVAGGYGSRLPDSEPSAGQAGALNQASSRDVCVPGAMRDCRINLGEREGVVTCFVGVHICLDGQWGPCQRRPDAEEINERAQHGARAGQS